MLALSLKYLLKGTNSSALENFNPLLPDFLGTVTMSGLRLRLELMSFTKWRTEYYLIKRKSISLLRVKTSSLVAFLFSDWIKKPIDRFRVRQYVLTDIDKNLLHHSIILLTDRFHFFQNTSV